MAQTHKALAQSEPSATTETTVYTAAALTTTIVSHLQVANTGVVSTDFRIHVVPSGGAAGSGNAVYYNVPVPSRDAFAANVAIVLDPGDFIVVYAVLATLTFTFSGLEIT